MRLLLNSGVLLVLQMVLKCADIGHLAAAPATHRRWAFQLEEEFFRQVCPCSTEGPAQNSIYAPNTNGSFVGVLCTHCM